jgi:hypothetical protein
MDLKKYAIKKNRGTRESRRLINAVRTSATDKAVLQGIAPYLADQLGDSLGGNFAPWDSNGDPCYESWEGVECNSDGYVTAIDFERWWNDGPYDGFCTEKNNYLDGKKDK